ncbi:pectate lyase [Clavibacter michiganensis]|uniref:pectate lyase n=3 Tax=Clavibacter michiganensis TaxID=28447 RepID=UPI002360055F|nr:pectate lyase [Clavibacter michiganensis]MDO4039740.1 pectate lyase [Clavibacter michiganensis]MDO4042849.1 pectate lyase [Clavibacter michiganensis]MDO4051849.1 pectate lyase [Clavibacter michiganensis]MDO4064171.1 pectate lyase [Clavibacter michiganensis]MDO4079707.1 pectate lyase [Clavibacter michiganensis]
MLVILVAVGGIATAPASSAHAAGLPAQGSSISTLPAFPAPTSVKPPRATPYEVPAGQTVDYGNAELNGSTSGRGEFQQPVILVHPGGTVKNVVIGSLAADGIHCEASCTIINMWSSHVGEDAVTLLDGSPASSVVTIQGGGVQHAYDKVVQMDGAGTVRISHFAASDIGSLVRSCGNCPHQYPRHMVVSDVFIDGGRYKVAGVNQNFGDTAKLDHITIRGTRMQVCDRTIGGRGTPAKEVPGGSGDPYPGVCDFSYATILFEHG